MKTRMPIRGVMVAILVLVVCLGCSPPGAGDGLQLELANLDEDIELSQRMITDCQLALDDWKAELDTLEAGATELRAGDARLAPLTVWVTPNPVVLNTEGKWMWQVTVSAGSAGVRLTEVIRKLYWKGELRSQRSELDVVRLFPRLDRAYLPAYGVDCFNGQFNGGSVDALGVVISGIDDNGNQVESEEVKVELLQPLPAG